MALLNILEESNNLTINDNYDFGDGELLRAAHCNDATMIEKLLSEGIDVNEKNKSDARTALHCAAISNVNESHYKVLEILLKNGADISVRDGYNRTPFFYLLTRGNGNIVQLFLDFNADVHEEDNDGDSLVSQAACFNKNVEVVALLTGRGLDVNHRNKFGKTPLHWTCFSSSDNLKMIKCLLKNGADMDLVDDEKNESDMSQGTPMLRAVEGVFLQSDFDEDSMKDSYRFMVEHTDFNLTIYKNIFDTLANNLLYDKTHLWKMIVEHLAKLQSLKIPVHSIIFESSEFQDFFRNYFKRCQQELLLAKNTKLTNSWVSFYNLLMDSSRKLKNYAGNESLIEDFEKSDCVEKFPIFGASMDKNVKKGIKRRELFDKSCVALSKCLPIFDSNHLIIKNTLDCVLSKKDLTKFCE